MFWKSKNPISNEEFDKLVKKISLVEGKLESLNMKIDATTSNLNSLRGLVNRKLSGEFEEENNSDENDESEDLNNSSPIRFG